MNCIIIHLIMNKKELEKKINKIFKKKYKYKLRKIFESRKESNNNYNLYAMITLRVILYCYNRVYNAIIMILKKLMFGH